MTDPTEYARNQAEAQLKTIVEMVSTITCDYSRLDEMREEKADYDADVSTRLCWAEEHPDDAEELLELEAAARMTPSQSV